MRVGDSNWFSRWEEELPSPEELMPLSQTLISPDLTLAFDIRNPCNNNHPQPPPPPGPPPSPPSPVPPPAASGATAGATTQPNSADFGDFGDLGSGAAVDEPARTLKRPRLVWTPQLHKRFVDAVAHLGIKNAVPKTIMQLMSVDGLTRENVASHLQKYRLYLKRMQGLPGGGGNGGRGLPAASDPATDQFFPSSPVPPPFLHPSRANSIHFLPFVPVPALLHHHHPQQIAAAAAVAGHSQLQTQYHTQVGHFGSSPNGQFEHPFLARQSLPIQRIGVPVHNPLTSYVEDFDSSNATGGRKVLTLFPTGDD